MLLVVGDGIDIVEVRRLRKALERFPRLWERLFSPGEMAYCSSSRMKFARLAGRFAAKEAVAKALGRSLSWRDVEIVNDSHGKPTATFSPGLLSSTRGIQVIVSISHGEEYAVAHALALYVGAEPVPRQARDGEQSRTVSAPGEHIRPTVSGRTPLQIMSKETKEERAGSVVSGSEGRDD